MNSWLLIILIFMATHRGTRLAVEDKLPFIAIPRQKLSKWLDPRGEDGKRSEPAPLGGFGRAAAYLAGCSWCASMWVGGAVVWATTYWTSVPLPVLVWLAASSFTGLLAAAEGWGEQRFRLNLAHMWLAHDDMEKRGYKMPDDEED